MDPIDKLIIVRGVALVISVNFYLHSRDMSSSFSSATAQTPSDKLIASGITLLMDTSTAECSLKSYLTISKQLDGPLVAFIGLIVPVHLQLVFFFRVRVRNW